MFIANTGNGQRSERKIKMDILFSNEPVLNDTDFSNFSTIGI